MTNRTMRRIGAGAALFITLFGITAVSQVGREPRTDAALGPTRITSADNTALISWLSSRTLPILHDATALSSTGQRRLELMPPMLVEASNSAVTQRSSCEPEWRPLAFGPGGREVAELCLGQPLLPMPRLELKTPPPLTLPSPSVFNSAFANDQLDPTGRPASNSAQQAATETLQLLESTPSVRWSTPAVANTASPPYANPLTWAVPKNQV